MEETIFECGHYLIVIDYNTKIVVIFDTLTESSLEDNLESFPCCSDEKDIIQYIDNIFVRKRTTNIIPNRQSFKRRRVII